MKTPRSARQSGNVMIYILLALVLIGALTVALSRQSDQGGDDLSAEQAELHASELIAYSLAAQNVVNQMIMSGSDIDDIDTILPSDAGFNTAPNIHKIYHPQGGGLNYKIINPSAIYQVSTSPPAGFYIGKPGNVEWTPTPATDLIFAVYQISKPVCEAINKKITGSTTIPTVTASMNSLFIEGSIWGGTNMDLTSGQCASCEGLPAFCVSRGTGDAFTFYSILEGR